ncbi:MAG: hypothetical protein ACI8RD_007883 [Bacillariaceae sp.]|jgi:hypothetical protein
MIMTIHIVLASCLILLSTSITTAFTTVQPRRIAAITTTTTTTTTKLTDTTIVSPFDESSNDSSTTTSEDGTTTTATKSKLEGPLDLTWDNVELVLDEMRHFLIQDGGNVIISEIDGPVVRLELQVRYYVINDVRLVCLCYHYESFFYSFYFFDGRNLYLLGIVLFYFVISDLPIFEIYFFFNIQLINAITYIHTLDVRDD